MERLDRTATIALKTLLDAQPTTAAKVKFAWTLASGAAMAQATDVSWSDDGVLLVRTRNAAWRNEVDHARPLIARRLGELLGAHVVRRMVVEATPLDAPARRG